MLKVKQVKVMMMRWLVPAALLIVGGCTQPDGAPKTSATAPSSIARLQIIAFNDFHGHIGADDQTLSLPGAAEDAPRVKAGGAVHFAQAVNRLRADNPNSAVVSAGDLISASPLMSGLFLDEPTVRVMNSVGIDFNAVGNHEFDRGPDELKRMQAGGCAKFTNLEPCQVMPDFPGARFGFLAANVRQKDGSTLFPPFGIKTFQIGGKSVKVGFVGMTLEGTPQIVAPLAVANLRFSAEAETANAALPAMRAAGADVFVILLHEGGYMTGPGDKSDCAAMTGALPAILAKLDPAFDLVISGHTHKDYVCNFRRADPARPLLVTSAGLYGMMLTRITLDYDVEARRLVSKQAENVVVDQRPADDAAQPEIASMVSRYRTAAKDRQERIVGRLTAEVNATNDASGQSTLGNLIADAQFEATRAPDKGGAQFAFMNRGGLRAPIVPTPQGEVRFGDIYSAQPFSNTVMVKQLTGAQIKAALEGQFMRENPMLLSVSKGFSYAYDSSRPAGQRVVEMRLDGVPLRDDSLYRVAMNNFIAQGGDGYTAFADGPVLADGTVDVQALEAYVSGDIMRQPPALDRVRNLTPH